MAVVKTMLMVTVNHVRVTSDTGSNNAATCFEKIATSPPFTSPRLHINESSFVFPVLEKKGWGQQRTTNRLVRSCRWSLGVPVPTIQRRHGWTLCVHTFCSRFVIVKCRLERRLDAISLSQGHRVLRVNIAWDWKARTNVALN